jgi:cell division protein FtsB
MKRGRIVSIIILAMILTAVLIQVFLIFKERNQLKNKIDDLSGRLGVLLKENDELRKEIDYLSWPENLEKELRARFNYKKPGEKMMIIVP